MNLYKIHIKPTSQFATTLKGDTIFGQLCWLIRYHFGEEKLQELLDGYTENKPFMIVSDAFAHGFLPKPTMPSTYLNEDTDDKKANRKKIWLSVENLQAGRYREAKTDREAFNEDKTETIIRNSINYKSFTTNDNGTFAPYGSQEMYLKPKDIFVLLDDNRLSKDELQKLFTIMGTTGFGKDTTIGKGRFKVECVLEVNDYFDHISNSYITLSPFCPQGLELEKFFYNPFVRFGKHGGDYARQNAFKKPLLLADSAAVIQFGNNTNQKFIGRGIKGHSKLCDKKTVHQGYAIVLPIQEI